MKALTIKQQEQKKSKQLNDKDIQEFYLLLGVQPQIVEQSMSDADYDISVPFKKCSLLSDDKVTLSNSTKIAF